MERLTNSQIDKLGSRLRHSASITADDLAILQRVRSEYDEALAAVQANLAGNFPGLPQTSRLKTVQTIVEKLQRERSMALSKMGDIAGVRIVRAMTREDQDVLVAAICDLWPRHKPPLDRRQKPSHGYRAVHVLVEQNDRLVEIQVRTAFQDTWAQTVERLGDIWGRQIRYGEGPLDPNKALPGGMTRQDAWNLVKDMGEAAAAAEEVAVTIREVDRTIREQETPSKERGIKLRTFKAHERRVHARTKRGLALLVEVTASPELL